MAGQDRTVATDATGHRTVQYQGDLVRVDGGGLDFKDGTVLRLAQGPEGCRRTRSAPVYVVIDAEEHVIQGATFAPPPDPSHDQEMRETMSMRRIPPPARSSAPPLPVTRGFQRQRHRRSAVEQQYGPVQIGAPTAWQKSTGKGVKVAMVDSGVDVDHPT